MSYRGAYQRYMQRNPRIEERYFSHSRTADQKVAIVTIEGAIMHSDGFAKWQIDQVARGSGCQSGRAARRFTRRDRDRQRLPLPSLEDAPRRGGNGRKIPLVVSMGGIAASGGYYVSMAAGATPESIFAERTTWTGSIGVIIPHYNIGDLLGELEDCRRLSHQRPAEGDGKPDTEAHDADGRGGA